ncbi:MAG TPA: ABC transporter substrate-binding protein [Verrucomicrobiae bacterium]|nr:ABC transporter substrate-binding protein [Verrucomicrobiae bacterium]
MRLPYRLARPLVAAAAVLVAAVGGASAVTAGNLVHPNTGSRISPPAIGVAGQLRICSDIVSPPLEYYSAGHVPTGSDVQIGNAIAGRLKLKAIWLETQFSGIIPALLAGHCDVIISQLFIKPARERVVNFLPYMYSGESIVVKHGNPDHITGLNDSLCGKTVATTIGTTAGLDITTQSASCTQAGKQPIRPLLYQDDIQALEQLALGRAQAYATTTETAAYYMGKAAGTYEFAGHPFGRILTGIAMRKGDPVLLHAMTAAFDALKHSGRYNVIMSRWGLHFDELQYGVSGTA